PTIKMDKLAEDAIVESLLNHGLSFTLISEEAGLKRYGSNPDEAYVVADPLDGSVNASRGLPFVATSLAYSRKSFLKGSEKAVVMDIIHGVTYTVERGCGAFKDNVPIKPSRRKGLKDSVLGIDVCNHDDVDSLLKISPILRESRHVRHLGANALEICYVADGTIDAFIELNGKMRVLDLAAAYLIVSEAGGVLTNPEGEDLDAQLTATERVSLIASGNREIHEAILEAVKSRKVM
ncbi:MAG: inositol monophosphatase family protein, partial [Candidatus Bathyarchaeia archaeon]